MYLYRLCHALGDAGHEVDVVHCLDAYHLLHPGEPEVEFAEHPKVTRHELRSRLGWLSPLVSQQMGHPGLKTRQIRAILESKPYDVVHFHNTSLLGPKVLAMVPSNARTITMYTAHEHWLVCPMHVLWKFNRRPCEKAACLRCTLIGKRPPQWWRYTGLLRRCSGHIDRFVAPSRFTAQMHAERGFPGPVDPLPYFIDRVDSEWRRPGPRPHHQPYFLFVGRLELIKGLQTLIPLWDRVPGADLLVAGTGGFEAELRAMAAENSHIKFLGPVSQKDLGPLYYHALACVVPSITYETFGMIIIEAFARKTPVVVRDRGPFPELIQESCGGFIFRTDQELLQALAKLASCPEQRRELGENGYSTFVEQWSREAHLRQYFNILDDLAQKKLGHVPWHSQKTVSGTDLASQRISVTA